MLTDERTCVCCGHQVPVDNYPAHLRECIEAHHPREEVNFKRDDCWWCGQPLEASDGE